MPIFGKKNKSKENLTQNQHSPSEDVTRPTAPETNGGTKGPHTQGSGPPPRPKLVFHCQLAQGSPTGIIQGFTNVKELYQKIADCYEMPVSELLFCTLNTHKIDMTKLLGGQIGLDDFIFAHIKGRPKEVDVTKDEDALGLTITDNGAGYAFIKRIKEGSIMDKTPLIAVGDHIEKLDGKSLIGCRHYEVAKMLKEIPRGTTFTLRVVQPEMSGFSHIGASSGGKKKADYGSGKQTLRLRANGPATVEEDDDVGGIAVDKINNLLESYMGINDTELAQSVWDMGKTCDNPSTFATNIDESEFKEFGFTDDFIFDLWGAISDAKQGRLKAAAKEFNEQF